MAVPVVALYGSLNALLNIYLANRVSTIRGKQKVSHGFQGNAEVELAARIHGNNAEFVPLALVMLLIAELQGLSAMWLHILGGALFVARVLHAYGMPKPSPNFGRFTGVAATWAVIVGTSVWILVVRFIGS